MSQFDPPWKLIKTKCFLMFSEGSKHKKFTAQKMKFSIKNFFSKCDWNFDLDLYKKSVKLHLSFLVKFSLYRRVSHLYRSVCAVGQRGSVKRYSLEISQNWPESTCARVSFFSKVAGLNPEAFFLRIPLVVASVCTWYLNTSAVTLLLLRSNTAIYLVIVQLPHKLELYLAFYVSFIVFLLIVIHETNKILISNYYYVFACSIFIVMFRPITMIL